MRHTDTHHPIRARSGIRRTSPTIAAATATLLALGGLGACSSDGPQDQVPGETGATGAVGAGEAVPSSSPTPAPVPTVARGKGFTLVATGDVLLHDKLWFQARRDAKLTGKGKMDFAPVMAGVQPYVAGADVGACHLETPLAAASGPFLGYPRFSGPPQVVAGLKATGYDVCSTASNHIFDQGTDGVRRTLTTLDAAGIRHPGSARTPAEARQITKLNANGVRIAYLSYTFGFNGGNKYPGGQTWRANRIDVPHILADARRARRQGAEAVVLAMHWGTEYQQTANAEQQQVAAAVADSGAVDLIIGHHAHVVQPVQKIGRMWVVYGLGNHIANYLDASSANPEGLLVRFTFARERKHARGKKARVRVSKAEYVPLFMTQKNPRRVLDIAEALRTGDYGTTTQARLRKALRRTTTVVTSLDAQRDGLRRAAPPQPLP